jgi:hypothetical protein
MFVRAPRNRKHSSDHQRTPEGLGTGLASIIIEMREHICCCDARRERLLEVLERVPWVGGWYWWLVVFLRGMRASTIGAVVAYVDESLVSV